MAIGFLERAAIGTASTVVGACRKDIRQQADVAVCDGDDSWVMDLLICFDETEPPTGRLRRVAASGEVPGDTVGPVPFTGWLGLLRTLSEVLSAVAPPGRPDHERLEP